MRVILRITRNTPTVLYYAVSAVLLTLYLLMVYSIRSLFGVIPAGLYGLFLILTWADRLADRRPVPGGAANTASGKKSNSK